MTQTPIFRTENLKKYYPIREEGLLNNLFGEKQYLRAVDDVNVEIHSGEIVGLAGQSGSGKSTFGELLALLREPTEGEIYFDGDRITSNSQAKREFRRRCQVIFQDPYGSLNPRFTVGRTLLEPLHIHDISQGQDRIDIAHKALEDAKLTPTDQFFDKYPGELSGGQQQRVAIARALVLDPDVIIADEPTSMLDVSVSTGILNLFKTLQEQRGFTMLYISHDLGSISYLTDRTMVMYQGNIVEVGETTRLINSPAHPYTKALLEAVPSPDPEQELPERDAQAIGQESQRIEMGCPYRLRCENEIEECAEKNPLLEQVDEDRELACYNPVSNYYDR